MAAGGPIHPVPQTTVSGTEQGKGRKPAFFRPKTPNAGEALGFLGHLDSTADYEDMVAGADGLYAQPLGCPTINWGC